jgi:lysophospholipase L1-like esterase
MNRSRLRHAAFGVLFCFLASALPIQSVADERWVASWAAVPDSAGPPLQAQTVRQIIRTSLGGSSLRIRLSNLLGTGPVIIGPVHVALHDNGAAIVPGSDHALTFGGKSAVTIGKGDSALSDPVRMKVTALQELAVSLYLPTHTGPATMHGIALRTGYITRTGDATAAQVFPVGATFKNRFFLTDVEVLADADAHSIVIVGDSITDGVGSTEDTNRRWPDALAARLQDDPALASIAVVNAGISGNRILKDGPGQPFMGPSVLSRFDRDALSKPGVRWVLIMAGINDISAAGLLAGHNDHVSEQQIIEGLRVLINRAHEKGIKIWGATLLPINSAKGSARMEEAEAKRQAVNAWIRTAGAFDAIVDFDQVVRDPAHPERFWPAFDSGDHLHPSDAGYAAMAASLDLRLFSMNQ